MFVSCATEHNALKWMREHPERFVTYCDSVFPSRERVDTIYSTFDTTAYLNAYNDIWMYADSLFKELQKDTGNIRVHDSLRKVFVNRIVKNTVYDTIRITRYEMDSIKVKLLEQEIEKRDTDIKYLKKIAADRINYIIGLASLVGTYLTYRMKKQFKKK